MEKINITGQMVIKNEDQFLWYAIKSVLPFIDKLLITDTGSSDNTLAIIDNFKDKKIELTKDKADNPKEISIIRQKQLKESDSDWIWIIDGDEVYPRILLQEILDVIQKKGDSLEGIIVGRHDLLGDIYNYQDNSAGIYRLWDKKGHFALRLINKSKIPGLHIEGIYPKEGYYDLKGIELINHSKDNYYFTKGYLHHAMYLKRSSNNTILKDTFNRQKFKFETGININREKLPEVFFTKRPPEIPDLTQNRSLAYTLCAFMITPLKKIKRRVF